MKTYKTYLSSIPMLIYRLAHRHPEKVAVIDSDLTKYTYRQLDRMADAIIRMFPVENPSRVGILTGAGIAQIAAVLAVVKRGAAYVPINPALSGASLRNLATKASIDFIIADHNNIGRTGDITAIELPSVISTDFATGFAPIDLSLPSAACALPFGNGDIEELSRAAIRKHARSLCDEFGITSSDVVLQSSIASSQMFLAEVFATFMRGATLAILPEQNRGYAKAVADFAERAGVTVICGYRPMVEELGRLRRKPSRLRMILGVASERLTSTLAGFNKARTWRGWFSRPIFGC